MKKKKGCSLQIEISICWQNMASTTFSKFPKSADSVTQPWCPRTHLGPPKILSEIVSPSPFCPSAELDGLCKTLPGHTLASMEC